jgi:RNA recognition motif-containing protein
MTTEGADAAMEALNGKAFGGRDLRINEAQERQPRTGGGYGGGARRNSW